MSLIDLQRGLKDHILHAGPGMAQRLGGGDPEVRLSVYHHAYRAQLLACLRDVYERTWAWLGDEAFERAGKAYVEAHPPSSWTLADYGEDFPVWLGGLYPADPEVEELAWLEWALRRAFDGPGARSAAAEDLAGLDWETASLRTVPTLAVRRASTNAAAIWGALNAGEGPPAAIRLPEPAAVRVWRRELSPQYRTIEEIEAEALALVGSGLSFGGVCIGLVERYGEAAAERIGPMLSDWIQDGLLAA